MIVIEQRAARAVVHVTGELDVVTSQDLRRCLADLLDEGAADLEVELGEVPFCDSSGLGALVGAHRRLRDRGGQLEVSHPGPQVRKLLATSGLDQVFEVR